LLAALAAASSLGCWLVVQDALQPASAIVVLNGETPGRALTAAALYHQRWAREIWLTQLPDDADMAERIRRGDIVDAGTRINLRVLREAAIPLEAVRVLPVPIHNTREELGAVGAASRDAGSHRLIIVTSKPHTRRARVLWGCVAGAPPMIVRHADDNRWDLARWWAHEEERGAVIHELAGLIVASLGAAGLRDAWQPTISRGGCRRHSRHSTGATSSERTSETGSPRG
jgi:hypothetical protein